MTRVALDASALLAMLLGEPGGEKVKAALDGAVLVIHESKKASASFLKERSKKLYSSWFVLLGPAEPPFRTQVNKRYLVLFFKKEPLLFLFFA